jgi:hypothetical protein
MRWTFALLTVALVAPAAPAQEGEAKKLFEAMEQKLGKARAHQVAFEMDMSEGPDPVKIKGMVIVADGNRLKLAFDGVVDGNPAKGLVVCDGTTLAQLRERDNQPGKVSAKPAPKNQAANLATYLFRAGLFVGVEASLARAEQVRGRRPRRRDHRVPAHAAAGQGGHPPLHAVDRRRDAPAAQARRRGAPRRQAALPRHRDVHQLAARPQAAPGHVPAPQVTRHLRR